MVDTLDAITFVLDSGTVSFVLGAKGTFVWTDGIIGTQTFYGAGKLMSIDLPETTMGPASRAVTVSLRETYLPEGSDTPVNIFDNATIDIIDQEEWENRTVIGSIFHLDNNGGIIEREQVFIRQIDGMPQVWDAEGNPLREAVLEEPDIIQNDVEGKTANKEMQALIDPTDISFQHVGQTQDQKITFGKRPEMKINGNRFGDVVEGIIQ